MVSMFTQPWGPQNSACPLFLVFSDGFHGVFMTSHHLYTCFLGTTITTIFSFYTNYSCYIECVQRYFSNKSFSPFLNRGGKFLSPKPWRKSPVGCCSYQKLNTLSHAHPRMECICFPPWDNAETFCLMPQMYVLCNCL